MKATKSKVLVIYGGPSNEHQVSVHTGKMIIQNLDASKYPVHKAYIRKDGAWQLGNSARIFSLSQALIQIERLRPSVALIALHGAFGEDGAIQTILQSLRIPFTGSGPLASALAMDKELSNIMYQHAGFLVPPFVIVNKNDLRNMRTAASLRKYPLVVKPVNGGSSVGISIVRTHKQLRLAVTKALREDDRAMIQQRIIGREMTCGVLDIKGRPLPLPITEIVPQVSDFFNYRAKYQVGASKEITPAQISFSLTKKMQSLAVKAHCLLGCKGMSRTDFIVDNKGAWILETNTIPGMTKTSLLPQEAVAAGISYPKMLDLIIQSALR